MKEEIINLKNQVIAQIMDANTVSDLEEIKISYFGRNGKLTNLIKNIKSIKSDQERKHTGALINDVKNTIFDVLGEKKNKLTQTSRESFDPTIPGKKPEIGHLHLVTYAIDEISKTFEKIGFVRARYPEVEWDWFAFESLNMPKGHPARDDWETFFY